MLTRRKILHGASALGLGALSGGFYHGSGGRFGPNFNTDPVQNALAYPASIPFGFDPTHPASKGVAVSVIASRANVINILTGKVGTPQNTGVIAAISDIGPGIIATPSHGQGYVTIPAPALSGMLPSQTIAQLWTPQSADDVIEYGIYGGIIGIVTGYADYSDVGILSYPALPVNIWGSAFGGEPILMDGTTSWFMGVSTSLPGGNGTTIRINAVLKNLNTGELHAKTMTSASFAATAGDGIFYVGGFGITSCRGPTSHAMGNTNFMTLADLVKWSARPYDFWHPRLLNTPDF